jgi:anti-sigma B factor antagonist
MKITQRAVGDVNVLTLNGRMVTEDGDALLSAIDGLVQQGRVKLVLDLRDVTYIDSSGLGQLVSKYVSVRRRGGDVKLLHLTPRSSHLFAITHLTEVFDMFDSEDEAVRAFGSSSFQAHTV